MRGLNGNVAAEPRLFAHDAATIITGALNTDAADGGFLLTAGGTGYGTGGNQTGTVNNVNITFSGSGTGIAGTVTLVAGVVTNVVITARGSGIKSNGGAGLIGTVDAISGNGSNAKILVTNFDIPFTEERGCVVYHNGSSAVSAKFLLESGKEITMRCPANSIVGGHVPLLVKQVVDADTSDNSNNPLTTNMIALY